MQYVDVALPVKTKTQQDAFTYLIPPALLPDIQVGRRVLVPFAGRSLVGTVIKLRAQAPVTKKGLLEVKKLIDPIPVFTTQSLTLAEQVAKAHGASLGQVLASAAPPPAPRTAQRLSVTEPPKGESEAGTPQCFALYQPIQERWQAYLSLITKAVAQGKQVLILFSGGEHAQSFTAYAKQHGTTATHLPASAEKSKYYQVWLEAVAGQHDVIVGTRKAVFLSQPRLGLIIIDAPSEYGYKEEQYPYYHAAEVAQQKAAISSATVIIGDAVPSLADWQAIQDKKLTTINVDQTPPTITLIDTSTYKKLLPDVLLSHIQETLDHNGRAAIYYNRKGEGRFYRCLECETAIYCQNCDTLLTVYAEDEKTVLRCGNCGFSTTPPYRCEACSSYRLGSVGLGVNSLARIIAQHFPEAAIATLSKDQPQFHPKAQITICTHQLFFQPPIVHFDLVATIHIDQILHGTGWQTNEEAYGVLARLAERTNHLIIQSSQLEHPVITACSQQNIDTLYTSEAVARQKHGYPPYAPITQLIVAGSDEAKVAAEATKQYNLLLEKMPQLTGKIHEPCPTSTGKRRGKYRYQIIVKAPLTEQLTQLIPPGWQIDPAPDIL